MIKMDKIKVMVNGLPGKMAAEVANLAFGTQDLFLVPYSLTGPEIEEPGLDIQDYGIGLFPPGRRDEILPCLQSQQPFIAVDFTHPSAVNDNAQYYCANGMNFVMGTTGGDRLLLEETVRSSDISAVIAPNMAKPIVTLQAMMQYVAETFPRAFSGYRLEIVESHQQGKADTSGTAMAMIEYFNALGIPFEPDQIVMVRNPGEQLAMGVPDEHLGGHGWHTYTLVSEDGTVLLKLTHNINGRAVYAHGALDAVRYLDEKVRDGEKGQVFSMINVLRGK